MSKEQYQHSQTDAPSFGVKLSDTILKVAHPVALANKNFTWPTLFTRDCTLGSGSLTVFDNGTAEWRASVTSEDDGNDSWGCRFLFLDDHNVPLWQHGWIWSPTLHPTSIDWVSVNQIFFASYIFPSISKVSMEYHC